MARGRGQGESYEAGLRGSSIPSPRADIIGFRLAWEGLTAEQRLAYAWPDNLDYIDLSGLDLSGLDMRGISMYGAKLDGADLTNTQLEESDLRSTSITGAKLDDEDLQEHYEVTQPAATFEGRVYDAFADQKALNMTEEFVDGKLIREWRDPSGNLQDPHDGSPFICPDCGATIKRYPYQLHMSFSELDWDCDSCKGTVRTSFAAREEYNTQGNLVGFSHYQQGEPLGPSQILQIDNETDIGRAVTRMDLAQSAVMSDDWEEMELVFGDATTPPILKADGYIMPYRTKMRSTQVMEMEGGYDDLSYSPNLLYRTVGSQASISESIMERAVLASELTGGTYLATRKENGEIVLTVKYPEAHVTVDTEENISPWSKPVSMCSVVLQKDQSEYDVYLRTRAAHSADWVDAINNVAAGYQIQTDNDLLIITKNGRELLLEWQRVNGKKEPKINDVRGLDFFKRKQQKQELVDIILSHVDKDGYLLFPGSV